MSDAVTDKATLLGMERKAFERWAMSLEGLAPETRRADGWTLLEVVAHVAAWHRLSADRLGRLARGERPGVPDIDAFNTRVRAEAEGKSWASVQTEAEAARRAFLAAVARLPDDLLAAHDGLGAYIVGANGAHHYEEHLGDFTNAGP